MTVIGDVPIMNGAMKDFACVMVSKEDMTAYSHSQCSHCCFEGQLWFLETALQVDFGRMTMVLPGKRSNRHFEQSESLHRRRRSAGLL